MNITIIGSGNVGSALAKRCYACGHRILQVFSREIEKATALAALVEATPCQKLKDILPGADVYLLAVRDDAIAEVATTLKIDNIILAHTSGTTSIAVFEGKQPNYGVFYPLQTFSANIAPDFEELPICVAGNNEKTLEVLSALAKSICPNVHTITEAQRQSLHVAAVFVNNFSNYLFTVGQNICEQENLDFDMLKPLIRQTVRKIELAAPNNVQTGPAARGDEGTIAAHLNWLNAHSPQYSELYKLLTTSILRGKRKD